ncbi:hypothetical protein IU433_17575 [Nocardia puris]|uniref:DUF6374 family protein n=1 Tax=Nocardia puris TaxID=208602 RepID=UPI0018949FCB|nr:DUF6374 family protein [Nocardia puris]MBF6212255.1 hypothetical protein [Nocardia puris]MBF6366502.1 hypothetical protein [Nocardia puris]MBF6460844.1 hypothetical protein [Nocardia puris]
MPELSRLEWARMNLDQVRIQLLDAAAFGKYLTPEQLEHAAFKIGEGMRVYGEETRVLSQPESVDRSVCIDPRRYRSR